MTEVARVNGGSYSEPEIERGLQAVAICSGNTRRAAQLLEDQGTTIPRSTLENWKHIHPERYQRIQDTVMPKIYSRIAERSEDIVDRMADIEAKLADKLEQEVPNLKPADVAGALRNAAVTKAVNFDKASLARGRPTEIKQTSDMAGILRGLERFSSLVKVNWDVMDAEQVSEVESPQLSGTVSEAASVQSNASHGC